MRTTETSLCSDFLNEKFPGVLIQGDTFFQFVSLMKAIDERAAQTQDRELKEGIAELKEMLEEVQRIYEDTLAQHKISLPYVK